MSLFDWCYYSSVGYTALVIALYVLSLFIPQAGFVARALVAYIALIVCALYGVFVSLYLRATTGKAQNAQWAVARAFHWIMFLTTGVRFTVQDPKNVLGTTRPAVFLGNHQTELDVLMLGAMFPRYCSVTAKASLKKVPFLGWFMSLAGSVFLDRQNSQGARQAMSGAANEMKEMRQSVYMFPEGTRSYSKEPMLLPFKKGAFHLAVQAQVPIVPVVVANYSHILWFKGMKFTAGTIPIKVLDPISTKGLTAADVDELTRSTRDLMLRELESLTAQARGQPMAMPTNAGNGGVTKASGREVKNEL